MSIAVCGIKSVFEKCQKGTSLQLENRYKIIALVFGHLYKLVFNFIYQPH